MKIFEIYSQRTGLSFEIGVADTPTVNNWNDKYEKYLEIECIEVNGINIPKGTRSNKLFSAQFAQLENKLCVKVTDDACNFIKKLKNLPKKVTFVAIPCSQELEEYYYDAMKIADAIIEKMKAEKAAAIQAAFDALTDDTILEGSYHSSDGYYIKSEAGKHEWFKTCFRDIKTASVEIPKEFVTEFNWGDYSITEYFKIPFGELKKLHKEAKNIIEPILKEAAERKAAREAKEAALKTAIKCEIIKKGKSKGEEWDPYAVVRLTNTETGESLEFTCRNIFDVGYVVNPNYSIVPGLTGGIEVDGKWQTFNENKGWYDIRELTEFEKLCMEYLTTFPPIRTDIRL